MLKFLEGMVWLTKGMKAWWIACEIFHLPYYQINIIILFFGSQVYIFRNIQTFQSWWIGDWCVWYHDNRLPWKMSNDKSADLQHFLNPPSQTLQLRGDFWSCYMICSTPQFIIYCRLSACINAPSPASVMELCARFKWLSCRPSFIALTLIAEHSHHPIFACVIFDFWRCWKLSNHQHTPRNFLNKQVIEWVFWPASILNNTFPN